MADDLFEIGLMLDPTPANAGVAAAVTMFRGVLDVLREAREQSEQLAMSTTRFRDSIRDIKSLSGAGPVDDKFLRSHLDFIRATKSTGTEAHDYVEQFLGEAEASRGKMAPAEFSKFEELGARYGLMMGGSMQTHGRLAGSLLRLAPQGATAGSLLGQEAEITRILQLGSGELQGVMKSYTELLGTNVTEGGGGLVGDPRSLAVFGMGASRLGPEAKVDTTVENFAKATAGLTRNENWNKFIHKDLRVAEGTKIQDAMIPLFNWMESISNVGPITGTDAEIAAKTKELMDENMPQGRDLHAALREKGLRDVGTIRAVIGMYGQRQSMIAELQGKGPQPMATTEGTLAAIDAVDQSPLGRQRGADSNLFAAQIEAGQRGERVRYFRTQALAKLIESGKIGPEATASHMFDKFLAGAAGTTREEIMADKLATKLAEDEMGVRVRGAQPGMGANILAGLAMGGTMLGSMVGIGPRTKGDMAKATEENLEFRQDIANWQAGAGVGLQRRIQQAEDARLGGDNRLYNGPNGRQTLPEMRAWMEGQGYGVDKIGDILNRVTANQQAGMTKPQLTARPAENPTP